MDVAKPRRSRTASRLLAAGILPVLLVSVWIGVDRIRRAAPTVERSTLWIGTVERGPLTLSVRGPGRLVPEEVRWVTATTSGKVERVPVEVGDALAADTVVVELSNDDLQLRELEARREVAGAEAELVNLHAQLEKDRLAQEATVASTRAELTIAKRTLEADAELDRDGLISKLEMAKDADRVAELEVLLEIERKRLDLLDQVESSQIAAQEAKLERLEALAEFRSGQMADLHVVATVAGVLQELPLEVGQWIEPGALIATVVQPDRLEAQIRVPQNQAREIQLGQRAEVDVRADVVPAEVERIDPAVQEGSVLVDLRLTGALPRGARPDMTVEGRIELDHLDEALFVQRPAFAQEHGTTTLFLLRERDTDAVRVTVRFGRASARTIEVLEGLQAGDRVILGDMTRWHDTDRLTVE